MEEEVEERRDVLVRESERRAVLVFVNKRKETNEKAPDFNVYEPEPRAETQQRQQTREAGDDSAERW